VLSPLATCSELVEGLTTGYSTYRGYLPAIASRSGEAGGESRSHSRKN